MSTVGTKEALANAIRIQTGVMVAMMGGTEIKTISMMDGTDERTLAIKQRIEIQTLVMNANDRKGKPGIEWNRQRT